MATATMTETPDLLDLVMNQAEADLTAAHAEICKLQGLDPAKHTWPEWSAPANTLRWFAKIRSERAPSQPLIAAAPEAAEEHRPRHYDRDGYCDNPARGY